MRNETLTADNTALHVTEEKLIDWSACASGKNWFLEKFPQGGMFGDVAKIERQVKECGGKEEESATPGYLANAATTGEHAVAAALGDKSQAKAGMGGAIVLCHRNDIGELIHIRASKVGENGIKADTWYSLDASGEFVEVDHD